MSLSICVFWLEHDGLHEESKPYGRVFTSAETPDALGEALKYANNLRKHSYVRHVCMSTENSDQVGTMGVDSIVDGKTPDGNDYTWKKRRV